MWISVIEECRKLEKWWMDCGPDYIVDKKGVGVKITANRDE